MSSAARQVRQRRHHQQLRARRQRLRWAFREYPYRVDHTEPWCDPAGGFWLVVAPEPCCRALAAPVASAEGDTAIPLYRGELYQW
jgi:hypothetical protein